MEAGATRTPEGSASPRRSVGLLMSAMLMVVAVLAPEASAQEVRVSATKSWVDHELLGDPVGLAVLLGARVRGPLGLRVGYGRSRQDFESFGTTCVGLVAPGTDCEGEVRSDRARMSSFAVSVPVVILEGERMTVALVPGGTTSSVSSVQVGMRTGRARSAEERMVGFQLGTDLRWRLSPDRPFHIGLTAATSWLAPWKEEFVADGYTPFNGNVRVTKLAVGVSVAR